MSHKVYIDIETADGLTLSACHWPKENAETVLLLHGYPDSQAMWQVMAERLAARFNVITYDVRGAGASSAPNRVNDYSFDCLAADFATVIEALNQGRPVHLLGHDWGSVQGWEFIQRSDTAPLIVSFTSACGPSLDHLGLWLKQRIKAGHWRAVCRQALSSWYVAAFHLPLIAPLAWRLGVARYWPQLRRYFDGVDAAADTQQLKNGRYGINLYRKNVFRRLLKPIASISKVPVQLIVANQDPFLAPAVYFGIEQRATRCRRLNINGGHWLPLSHPDELLDCLEKFVNTVGSDSLDAKAA